MAKKSKDEPVPTINNVPNRDIIQRLNFMYQASAYLQSLQPPSSNDAAISPVQPTSERQPKGKKGKKKKTTDTRKKTMSGLAQTYVRSMKVVGQRTTVKMDPSIKRTICKGCDIALLPGSTVSTRVQKLPSHGQAVVYTCLNCNTKRRIPAPPTLPAVAPVTTSVVAPPQGQADAEASAQNPFESLATVMPAPHNTVPTTKQRKIRAPTAPTGRPRQPLLFARKDAGHVVFRGNERLMESDDPA